VATNGKVFPVTHLGKSGKSAPKSPRKGSASDDALPFLRVSAEWKGYVNVEQSEATKDQFWAFYNDANLVREITAEVLLAGYKLSIVQVDNPETCKASAYAAFSGMVDAGYTVSAWGDSLDSALAAVVFIVGVQARKDLSQFATDKVASSRRTF